MSSSDPAALDTCPDLPAGEGSETGTPDPGSDCGAVGVPEEEIKTKLGQGATAFNKIHLRMRVVGGGCSGFTNKLDLDPEINPKLTMPISGQPSQQEKYGKARPSTSGKTERPTPKR